ncbi:MAG: hypothetical protein WA639_22575 [Candidatus Acidiferrum sp.]
MRSERSVFLFIFVFVTVSATAQQPTPPTVEAPQRDIQAVALLQQAFAALGGAAPTSMTASGTYTRYLTDSTVSYPLRVEVLGVDKFHWEVDTPDLGTVTTVVSGTASWSQSTQGTQQIPIGEIPGKTLENFPLMGLSNWAISSATGLKMVGTETIAGKAVFHVTVTPTLIGNTDPKRETVYEATHKREIYLDQQTGLPFRLRYYRHPLDWRVGVAVDIEYSNFQTVGGISFPMTITAYMGDQKITQIQYQSLNLNASIPDADFVEGAIQ